MKSELPKTIYCVKDEQRRNKLMHLTILYTNILSCVEIPN